MDIQRTINELRNQALQLEYAIRMLEKLAQGTIPASELEKAMGRRSNRGRKSMGPEERKEVSRRMKAYWASQRRDKKK